MNEKIAKIYSNLPMSIKARLDELKQSYNDMNEYDFFPEIIAENRKFIDGYIHALSDLLLIENGEIEILRSYITR